MGFLQRWLDEPDEGIARFAKAFYAATFLFMATFAWQTALLLRLEAGAVRGGDAAAPLVSLFLAATMYALALDGRRSYKQAKAARGATALKDPEP